MGGDPPWAATDDSIADRRQGVTTRLNRRRRHCEKRK
jgi:hypothetical protein